jgi:hypothetical protein
MAKENAFAALGHKYTRVGKIIDIGEGGLAFEYITGEEVNNKPRQIDIFLVGTEFHLYKVQCKVIYSIDAHVPKINNKLDKIFTTKRCGVQFEQLTKDYSALLKFFLKYHTV